MSKLREHLAQTLKKKIDRYGIVVWVDEHGEYGSEVVKSVVPGDARVFSWEGSWYALRRQIEPLVSDAAPPRLVIYQGARTPEDDPLAEVREAGTEWKIRLRTLIREALKEELSAVRLEEVARQARTVEEAEAALTAGPIIEVRLQAVLKATDPIELGLRLLADSTDQVLEGEGLWEDARRFLQRAFGGQPRGTGQTLRKSVVRHLILIELGEAVGRLPESLRAQSGEADADQRGRARELLARWRRDIARAGSYRNLAREAERDLGLSQTLTWDDRLADLDTVPALETLALGRALDLLEAGAVDDARALASTRRQQSFWVRASIPEARGWQCRWELVAALAELGAELSHCAVPMGASAGEMLQWYASQGWRVDRAHRRFEALLTDLHKFGSMENSIRELRRAYEAWLEKLLEAFTRAVEGSGLEGPIAKQTRVFKEYVQRSEGKVAYFLVDALRYELGQELAESLKGEQREVEISAAVATPPTITPVGMAALLPGAERGLSVTLSPEGGLEVFVDNVSIRSVQDRLNLVRAWEGQIADFSLNQLFDFGENELRERIGPARLVIVRSQEIDQAFESDHTAAAWRYLGEIRELLDRAVARLSAAGVEQFVIAVDHGFVILSRPLGAERTIDHPGGQGEMHRRCWVGRGGSVSASTLRIPLAELEVAGDLDLVVPRGLAIFAAPGARRFLHGGLSPQELLIPVITVRVRSAATPMAKNIVAAIASHRITTGVFSASLSLSPDLFTTDLKVRIVAQNRSGQEVARIVAGEGYDERSGVVTLLSRKPRIVTFCVTEPLKKGDRVTLHVYEAETDRLLSESQPAEVATEIGVD